MKKKWIFIGLGVAVVAVLVILGLKQRQGKVTAVDLAKVTREDVVSHVKAPGKIEPFTLVKMSATLPGKITYLEVKEGQRVKRGQVLLKLDPTQYEAEMQRATAALSSAEELMKQARYNRDRAQQVLERKLPLAKRNLVSPEELEQAQNAADVSRAAYDGALHAVSEARATLAAARDNLDKTTFTAPFDGVVSALNVEKGENVITGTMNNPGTEILAVADTTRMIVRANVDETDVVNVRVGESVNIKVDAFTDSVFRGQVIEVGNTAKSTSSLGASQDQSTFEVKVVFLDHIPNIRPGMTGDVDIQTMVHKSVLSVPIQSVVVRTRRELDEARAMKAGKKKARPTDAQAAENETEAQKKAKEKEINGVFVVRKGVATFVPVTPGIAGDLNQEVLGDIQPGDEVVSGPYKELRALKDGSQVKKSVQKKSPTANGDHGN